MNKLLERAVAAVAKLPEEELEAIASRILQELEEDLAGLSRQAGEHIARGTTLPYDPSDRPGE